MEADSASTGSVTSELSVPGGVWTSSGAGGAAFSRLRPCVVVLCTLALQDMDISASHQSVVVLTC